MADLNLKMNSESFTKRSTRLLVGLTDMSALTKEAGDIMHASIQLNFDSGGRPPWKRLAPATVKRKGHDRILIGKTGNLQNIVVQPGPMEVRIGTNPSASAYAAVHQYGGRYIPARRYMLMQREDRADILLAANRYLVRLGAST